LKANFTIIRGVIRRKLPTYVLSNEDESAIDYLFWEWDYVYFSDEVGEGQKVQI